MHLRHHAEAGFTIVEVLVAAFVLVIGILATLTLFASAQTTSKVSQRNEVAVREAEHQIEQMRGQCYGALTMQSAHPVSSGADDDPLERITATQFTVSSGLAEDVVTERVDKESDDNCTDSDGDGEVDAAVAPVTPITIGSGSSAVTGTVYRFVSWRDEECPILNLANLEGIVQDLQAVTMTLASPTGTLTSIAGPSGSLVTLINKTTTIKGTVAAGSLLQRALLAPLLAILNPLLTGTLSPVYATLEPIVAPLQALLQPLEDLLDLVSQHVDLCDLPELVDLSSFKALGEALEAVQPALTALQAPLASLTGIINPLVNLNIVQLILGVGNAVATLPTVVTGLTTAVTNLNAVLASDVVKDTAASGPANIKALAETATTAIATLVAQPDTTHNTKRLTVAVWLDGNGRDGLRTPFWASSVVSDPKDGLL